MILLYVFIFVVGSLLGSFSNVCIWRLPRGESIILPGSYCPRCKKPVRWFDNIPLISFILLKGRCRNCQERIPFRYPLVEFLGGTGLLAGWLKFGLSPDFLFFLVFFFILLIIAGIDFYHQIIPDKLSLPLIAVGLLYGLLPITDYPRLRRGFGGQGLPITSCLAGLLAGAGFLWLAAVLGKKIYKKEAMGGGDVKLAAGIGACLGWEKIFWVIMLAAGIGALSGLLLIILKKKTRTDPIPFGPFLAAGAILLFFF